MSGDKINDAIAYVRAANSRVCATVQEHARVLADEVERLRSVVQSLREVADGKAISTEQYLNEIKRR